MRLFRPSMTGFNALILGLMLCVSPIVAQAQLKLLINQGQTQGQFSIDGDVTYATGTGLVSMDVLLNDQAADAQNPLMCFDFSDSDPAVKLQLKSQSSTGSGGSRLLVDKLGLTSALQYQLAAKTIAITPSSDVACFFKAFDASSQTLGNVFGLYGQAPSASSTIPQGVIFQDNFSAVPSLDVAFTTVTSPASNGSVSYSIVATNNSPFSLGSLALQQTVPLGLDVTVSCSVNGQSSTPVCTTARIDTLRYVDFTLAAGASLELQITASRNANWPSSLTALPIFVAFAAPTLTNIAFDVAETTVNPSATQ